MIVLLANVDGPVSAAAFCTRRSGGFTREEKEAIERIVPALRNVCELRTLRKFELTLLDTYTGKATAQRILAGRIRRGQIESLEAALMIRDLRGFTEISNRLPGGRVLEVLDCYFDRVVPAITEGGGEIVKFMGDAVLAFFQREEAAESCRAAMQAARTALGNLVGPPVSGAPMNAVIALHYGEMSYGNIGSGRRLDFTVIGPDVNLMSRIQAVCAATGEPVLVSERRSSLRQGLSGAGSPLRSNTTRPNLAASHGIYDAQSMRGLFALIDKTRRLHGSLEFRSQFSFGSTSTRGNHFEGVLYCGNDGAADVGVRMLALNLYE
ncbi:adenylate/guanylate cyclase domain-containing protein [Bradyrhizobium erythrophlei]|uniref:adenylate/guanylate cyclase domain-containing protein n=1 Tax=Bradyrhizobium erythrophlei TaxID=1437360 RepID=UPI0035EF6500